MAVCDSINALSCAVSECRMCEKCELNWFRVEIDFLTIRRH